MYETNRKNNMNTNHITTKEEKINSFQPKECVRIYQNKFPTQTI